MKLALALTAVSLTLFLAACDLPASPGGALSGTPPATAEAPAGVASDDVTPAAPPEPEPQRYRGRGDKVVRIKDGDEPWLAKLTHKGGSNFIVSAIDSSGGTGDILVNVIGRYKGTVLLTAMEGSTRAVKIEADGAWTLHMKPPSDARVWEGARITGKGDDVLGLAGPSAGLITAKLTHAGSANFIVSAFSENDTGILVNEIGRYSGEVLLPDGTFMISVHADGKWTLTQT